MSLFKKLRGVIGHNLFQFDGPEGPQFRNASGVIELRDKDDGDYAQGRVADIVSGATDIHDAINLLMAQSRIAQIQFSFAGAGAPGPGGNTGKFGLCHTAGGGFAAGDVVYDNGAALVVMPPEVCRHVTTTAAITGTVSMIANGLYSRDAGVWTMKGDVVSAYQGLTRCIEVDYAWNTPGGTISSTAAIEAGARVLRVYNRIDTAFDGALPSLQVDVDGSVSDQVIMATTDSNLKKVNTYLVEEPVDITANTAGPIKLTIVPGVGAANGAGKVVVEFSKPFV